MTEEQLGKRIIRLRKEMGLSQLQMANLCELQSGHLANIEHGRRSPTLATLNRIAEGVGITVSQLVADDEPSTPHADETMNMVMVHIKHMEPEARRELIEIVKHVKLLAKKL